MREYADLDIYDERFQFSGGSKANLLLSDSGSRWSDGKLAWGAGGRRFKSSRPDQENQRVMGASP